MQNGIVSLKVKVGRGCTAHFVHLMAEVSVQQFAVLVSHELLSGDNLSRPMRF